MLVDRISKKLEQYEKEYLTRKSMVVSDRQKNHLVVNQQPCINFCSNDYLGMSQHPAVMNAFVEGVKHYGMGSSASPLVSGYFNIQQQLEEEFAEFFNFEKAIFFNSGYSANLGVITALANRSSTIVSDKLSHASLLDAIQLSRAKHYRYKHNDIMHLTELSEKRSIDLIVTESVFSMEGDIAPLPQIINLAKKINCKVIIDDAHGIGLFGKTGIGISGYFNLSQNDITCLIAPLGKAFACIGGIVAGNKVTIDAVLQFARSYRYSTALPPAVCAAALQSLKTVKTEHWRREKLNEFITHFIILARSKGLKLVSEELTPIKSIIVGDNKKVAAMQNLLLEKGIFVSCIRPPTVPDSTARIRISLNCLHTKTEINLLIEALARILSE